ncbi:MAG: histidine triad nucleotide-binding protein [Rhabdochlamydiaceae bacterium]|nr:histidine triad nucleotide-binding protein [Rhabdochlamydiaceae bacterium]
MSTVFSKIIAGELPCDKVFENDRILAFKDIAPVAPVHLLIVPKKPFPDLQSVPLEELPLIAECLAVAQKLAVEFGIAEGYRLLTNNGPDSGQIIFHLHFHLIGGRKLHHLG